MSTFPGEVVCDVCGWHETVVDVRKYRDAECPDCGVDLMDDTDKAAMDVVGAAIAAGLVSTSANQTGEPHEFLLNTGALKRRA